MRQSGVNLRAEAGSQNRRLTRAIRARTPLRAGAAAGGPAAAAAAAGPAAASMALAAPLTRGMGEAARGQVAGWIGFCGLWVYSMVVLGGVTRLTRSGLSMTDWKFTGERPPLDAADWEAEFAKYRQSPEFKKVNLGMSLEEFKFIYFMEWAHRMWGRALGFAFLLPFGFFAARGAATGATYLNPALRRRLLLIFAAGGGQGLVGWWMVKSGLEEPADRHAVPRVSPYRLAAHLTSAFAIYGALVWTYLSVAMPQSALMASFEAGRLDAARHALRLRAAAAPVAALVAVTAVSGAFVAGLDAGHAYNTFPLMGDPGRLVPEAYWDLYPELGVRNFFENTAAVQFDHRALATATVAAVGGLWAAFRRAPLPPRSKTLLHLMLGMVGVQFSLGVSTLLLHVPVSLGSAHQAGALMLMTLGGALLHSLRVAPGVRRQLLAGAARAAKGGA